MNVYKLYPEKYSDGFFDVERNGFLPVRDPLPSLPERYDVLQRVIDDLPACKENGILSKEYEIVNRVQEIPNYIEQVKTETDIFVLQALFRAYTFVASAYTLELSYIHFKKTGEYGVARRLIPENISVPLVYVSEKIKAAPWLDYSYAYSTGNYIKKDPKGTLHWDNLKMACAFSGNSDESNFIMLHNTIVEQSPRLIRSIFNYGQSGNSMNLEMIGTIMEKINEVRRQMWKASNPSNYNSFRVFIMGVNGNEKIFGDGVIYDKCFDNRPQKPYGQTGAMDSIIPTMDIFTGVADYYPENELTKYLMNLRQYRPVVFQNFLKDLREYHTENKIYDDLIKYNDWNGLVYLLKIVDEIYLFRNGHWQFIQKYIMANTKYATATGGSPITSWALNQIEAVLEFERVIISSVVGNRDKLNTQCLEMFNKLYDTFSNKKKLLLADIEELKDQDYDIDLVYSKNIEFNLEDKTM